jgi:hypothetical protein
MVASPCAARPAAAVSEARTGPLSRTELAAYAKKSRTFGLARSRQWLRLGHYRPALFGGYESEADAAQFFLAPEGKSDPEAELVATFEALFSAGPDDDAQGVQHPFCRFPARRRFLIRALEIPASRLPARACARLDAFLSELRPVGATLVFSSYYLNNPASAFGHTFLRIERRAKRGDTEGSDLLDSGVDYSASVDTGNALLYALKGLMGLFPGHFHKIPYYAKVREYNDFESRDLWEYELALSADEVELVALHLWELGSTYFAYYYLSENCSYHVLGLLEAASPRLSLLGDLGWPVIPAETVKALFRNPGLVRSVHYRPSNRTALRLRLAGLNAEELDALAQLMRDPRAKFGSGVAPARQVKVLDTALDLIDVRLARDLVKEREELGDEGELQQELLTRRSEYDVEPEQRAFAPPFRTMPHLGHGSRRLGLGGGYARDAGYYQTLNFRLALHDSADPVRGYPAWASIEFLPFTLRWRLEQEKLTLEDAALVRVESLSPWTRFERPLSFRTGVGFTRTHDRACEDCPTGFAEVGGGVALAPFRDVLMIYGFGEARLLTPFDAGLLDFFRFGVGPLGGIALRVTPDVALTASGRWSYLPGQKPDSTWSLEGKLRLQYTHDFALGVEAGIHPESSWAQAVSYLYF